MKKHTLYGKAMGFNTIHRFIATLFMLDFFDPDITGFSEYHWRETDLDQEYRKIINRFIEHWHSLHPDHWMKMDPRYTPKYAQHIDTSLGDT